MKGILTIKAPEKLLMHIETGIMKEMKNKYPKQYENGDISFIFGHNNFKVIITDPKIIEESRKDFRKKTTRLKMFFMKKAKVKFKWIETD